MHKGETTIDELKGEGYISTRTYNSLKSAGLVTLADIVAYIGKGEALYSLSNFGRKSMHEVTQVLKDMALTPHKPKPATPEATERHRLAEYIRMAYDAALTDTMDASNLVRHLYNTPEELDAAALRRKPSLYIKAGYSQAECVALRRCCAHYVNVLLNIMHDNGISIMHDTYADIAAWLGTHPERLSYEETARHFISPALRYYMQRRYDMLASHMLARTYDKFRLEHFRTFDLIIPYFDRDVEAYKPLCRGHRLAKTLEEMVKFTARFKEIFLDSCQLTDEQVARRIFMLDHTHLSQEDVNFAISFRQTHGHYPMAYVAMNHLKHADADPTRAPQPLCIREQDLKPYEWVYRMPYITKDTPQLWTLAHEERMDRDYMMMVRIIQEVFKVTRNGRRVPLFNVMVVRGYPILYNPDVIPQAITRAEKMMAPLAEHSNSMEELRDFGKVAYKELGDVTDDIFSLMCYISRQLGAKPDASGAAFILQNKVNINEELCAFLRHHGKPMTLDELFETFKLKYPLHRFITPAQMEPYIHAGESIQRIEGTNTYGLTVWTHLNYAAETTTTQTDDGPASTEEHINRFLEFVESHHRFPLPIGNEQEKELQQWLHQMTIGNIAVTDRQSHTITDAICKYTRLGYPTSATDLHFLNHCEEMKDYVREHNALPTEETDRSLHAWYAKAKAEFMGYDAVKRKNMLDLLQFLLLHDLD